MRLIIYRLCVAGHGPRLVYSEIVDQVCSCDGRRREGGGVLRASGSRSHETPSPVALRIQVSTRTCTCTGPCAWGLAHPLGAWDRTARASMRIVSFPMST
uniref:Uncharacterized protein n=1 Tax=Eutreptiella gymnastica TaxID=73025 RepID=A0A7S1I837_9EUGL